jgi:hypothetical protein
VHLLVDSTGLKLCGAGEWLVKKHGTRKRRFWRKMHIGVDANTGQIVAATLTPHDVDDGAQVGPLLDQVDGPIASFIGDGAYDQDGVYASVAERHPDADGHRQLDWLWSRHGTRRSVTRTPMPERPRR